MKIEIDLKDLKKFEYDYRALIIYSRIKPIYYVNDIEFWFRSDKWAERMNCTTATIQRALRRLIDLGYVKDRYHQPFKYVRTKKYRMVKTIAEWERNLNPKTTK